MIPEHKHFVEKYSKRYIKEDERTGDEIAADVINRLGLKVV